MLVSFKGIWNRAAVAALICSSAWGQAPSGPQWKDQAEYGIYESIGKETDAQKKLALLNQWKEKYPGTEMKKLRAQFYLQTYQALGQNDNIYASAKDVLAEDPKDVFALSMISYLTPVKQDQSPAALELGEKSAQGVIAGLDATFDPAKKPANMTAEQWAAQRNLAEAQSHKTLGWISMIRKDSPGAQDHFTKSLEKNAAQGDVSYWLGQTIMAQKNLELYPLGLWHVARAVSYDGPNAIPAAGRTQINDYLTKAYSGYHGDASGLDEVKNQAKAAALPPSGFTIKSVKKVQEEKLAQEEAEAQKNPKLAFWKRIKDELVGPNGQAYFDSSMKDAQIPELTGYLVEQKGKQLVIAISDKTTPEITLEFEAPVAGKADPGTELTFTGVGKSFSKEPFMVTMGVERKDLKGWPSAAPAKRPAGARKPAARRR